MQPDILLPHQVDISSQEPFCSFEQDGWRCTYAAKTFDFKHVDALSLIVGLSNGEQGIGEKIHIEYDALHPVGKKPVDPDDDLIVQLTGVVNDWLREQHIKRVVHGKLASLVVTQAVTP